MTENLGRAQNDGGVRLDPERQVDVIRDTSYDKCEQAR